MKRILWAALLGFFSMGVASVVERIVFAQASQYPAWFATSTIQRLAPGSLAQLRAKSCGGNQPIEIFEKQQQFLLRCGIWWPQSKTWIVPRTPGHAALLNSPDTF